MSLASTSPERSSSSARRRGAWVLRTSRSNCLPSKVAYCTVHRQTQCLTSRLELTSRDHSATNTFLHLTRYFQGEGLPPSNAVHAHPLSETDEALPAGYYEARKGRTTFFFRFPLPPSSPASIDFNKGLAKLKYEVRASAGISWRSEMQRVTERKEIMVVELPVSNVDAEQVVVAENGKFWVQGRLLGPYVIAGRTSCLELFVKNHSLKSVSSNSSVH